MQGKEQQRRARVATYEKGQARIEAILEAAAEVLISQGYKKFLLLRQQGGLVKRPPGPYPAHLS